MADDIEAAARAAALHALEAVGVRPNNADDFDEIVDNAIRTALALPRETTDAEAVRHAAAEIARRGAVAFYKEMAAAPRDGAQRYTYADVVEAVGGALSECEAQIRALQLDAAKGGDDAR